MRPMRTDTAAATAALAMAQLAVPPPEDAPTAVGLVLPV